MLEEKPLRLVLIIFFCVSLLPGATAFTAETVTITVTITIEPFQQLKLESKDPRISVLEKAGNPVSRVELNKVNSRSITLESALAATVKSNVEWRVLTHKENSYVIENGSQNFSSGPELSLGIPNLPNGANRDYSGNWAEIGTRPEGIATGNAGSYGPFDISYRLDFENQPVSELTGAGVDVVYTMMEL